MSSSMKQTGYHGSSYLVTWESQPHHLSWEIKRVGPVDGPRPMAGAALLPRHGGFTSGPRMDLRIIKKEKAEEQSDVELTSKQRLACHISYPRCACAGFPCVLIRAVRRLSTTRLKDRQTKENKLIICCPHGNSCDWLDWVWLDGDWAQKKIVKIRKLLAALVRKIKING